MAEISDLPKPQDEPEFVFDPESMRKTKPGLKRLSLTLSVLLCFILGFPILWRSVEIHRAPLPFREIETLSSRLASDPLPFPCRFHAIFLGFASDHSAAELQTYLRSRVAEKCEASVVGGSDRFLAVDFDGDDEAVDEALESLLRGSDAYTVVAVKGSEVGGVRSVVGKYRHAWVYGGDSVMEAVERAAEIFVGVFGNGGKGEGEIRGEFMPVGADGRIVLSFNLLNSDPRDGVYDWDFQKVEDTLLAPVIEALKPVANISVESQVLYHAPKSSFSHWDDSRSSYIFRTEDLPFFVNSNEWHLDTSVAAGGRSKILHFVVYVPSAKECPLLLQLPDGEISKTNGFISPMWGGVTVWNPDGCHTNFKRNNPLRHTISHEDLQKTFEVLMGQLRQLFGLKSDNVFVGSSVTSKLLSSERGFTIWELDVLSRQHTCSNLHSCATTLGSLSRLVQSLPRMIIMDEIGKQVHYSLEAAKLAQTNASLGVYDASAVASREAKSLAEDAFFHPSIMSVSYYSFEHCFAVYSPFFLPVSMHVILAALREWRRYKKENRKYLAWKTKLNKSS